MGERVTLTSQRQRAGAVSTAVVRAMLDAADKRGYGPRHRDAPRVLGIFGDPKQTRPEPLEHAGTPVSVVPCTSALAVRAALLDHAAADDEREDDGERGWLVIITDRPEEDLGTGILAHLAGGKLRTPDPWGAVRQQFAATGLEPALYAAAGSRALAQGLLAARPEKGWPPAPAGALTRDHALGAVAREHLELRPRSLDLLGVLRWTADPVVPSRLADLRQHAGDDLVDATIDWICEHGEASGDPVRELVRRGELADAVPLGLAVAVLADVSPKDAHTAELGLARLVHRWGGQTLAPHAMRAWGEAATSIAIEMLNDGAEVDEVRRILARGDQLLDDAGVAPLAARSDVLPAGLTARRRAVAAELTKAVAHEPAHVEEAWASADQHYLAASDHDHAAVLAAVRLVRWLNIDSPSGSAPDDSLAALAQRQSAVDAWVDAAVNDAYVGVADPVMGEAVERVLKAVRTKRDTHDEEFATALATATRDEHGAATGYLDGDQPVWLLENVLRSVVVPLARATTKGTLLLVLDGMSTGVATEVMEDIRTRHSRWSEALLPGTTQRACALAVLPTLTEISRTSLLTGSLTSGGQNRERSGYDDLTNTLGLGSILFHKKPLDTTRAGFAVADDIAHAIADTDGKPLVTCILNTIDDALDRSDPAGTTWTADAIKHLRPLLDQALVAGRTVVLTADHGHVVERRAGRMQTHTDTSSNRSRSADTPAGPGEVLISGPRVVGHNRRAVLAVDERLRYGPLKAGYHGGASPAEAVVPLIVLTPDEPSGELRRAPAQAPLWWNSPVTSSAATVPAAPDSSGLSDPSQSLADSDSGALFEADFTGSDFAGTDFARSTDTSDATPEGEARALLSDAVVRSDVYAAQREMSRRVSLTDEQVGAALNALTAAPGTRQSMSALAGVLALPEARMRGAVAQLQQLLNVEGYGVIRTEGSVVILDEPLLREQFGVG
ncbi:MAG TPA: BREX-2 system phosphatase PglZ [Beutenbergiaceae bacterium]|nr:BREX-2 system phosphatase PglZ [Beutenbergiaceae bacterium]